MRESRWWRLGLALRNRRNVLFALRHPLWAFKTLAGLRTRRGRLGRGARQASAVTARQWLVGITAEPRVPEDLWIAGIFDDELVGALEPDCNLITFRPDNWEANLEGRRPHMLLVESAERGNDGSWEYRIASTPHADAAGLQDLRALIEWCRANRHNPLHDYVPGDFIAEGVGERFDLVFAHAVVDHVYDIDAFVRAAVEASNRWIYLTAYRGWFPDLDAHRYNWSEQDTCFYNDLSPTQIQRLLVGLGCRMVAVTHSATPIQPDVWEAVIVAMHDSGCILGWRDYPDEGLFQRDRHYIAMLYPEG